MSEQNIIFLADPHLGHDKPGHMAAYEEVLVRAKPLDPQLVVVLGDVTMDGKKDPSYFPFARDQIARFGCDVWCIPGNHEEGYNVDRTTWPPPVEASFLPRFEKFFNAMPWTQTVGNVQVLGIDSQILGSGLPQEAEQITWLNNELPKARAAGRYVVVVMHTPLYVATPGPDDDPHDYWAVPHAARGALLDCLRAAPPDLLLGGHVHRHIDVPCDFAAFKTLASSSFQANSIWSVPNDQLPVGDDELCFYHMDAAADRPTLTRQVLDHQDRYNA